MFCKKNMGLFFLCVLFIVWAYFTYDVNRRFPSPENVSTQPGETTSFKGIKLTSGDMEIYDYEGLINQYPQVETAYYIMDEERKLAEDAYHFIIPVTIENSTENPWSIGKEGILSWVMETGTTNNGMDFFSFEELNPDYDGNLEPGESQEIRLTFSIIKDYMTMEEAIKWDKKIIYSYYPSKNYLYYPGEE